MDVRFGYQPLDVYSPFHSSSARERLLVGGFGSGKTVALCADAIARGLRYPGTRILLTRKTAPEVRDTLEPVFLEVLPHELLQASTERRAGGHIESITLPNGTKFLFRSIDDWRKHKSLNIAAVYFDELSEFDQETYQGMLGRLRQRELTAEAQALGYAGQIPREARGAAAATNPAGHDWIWERFVDKPERGVASWTATSLDNPHLPADYLKTLLEYPEPWVQRYVLCSFDDFAGQVYPDWTWNTHMYVGKLEISHATPVWMGFDPGTRNPTAALWVVVKDGVLYAVGEHKMTGVPVETHVERFRVIEADLPPVEWRVADPNIEHRDRGTAVSLRRQYAGHGFHFSLGPVKEQHRVPMLQHMVSTGRIMATPRTPEFFRQMSDCRWEDLSPSEKSKLGSDELGPEKVLKKNVDLVDCAQYLSSRVATPPKARFDLAKLGGWEAESLEIHAKIRNQQNARLKGNEMFGDINV